MKNTKSYVLFLAASVVFPAFLVVASNSLPVKDQDRTNQQIIEEVNRLEKNIASFNCSFVVQSFLENQKEPKKGKGTIVFKAPSLWRFEQYAEGAEAPYFMMGCNGKKIWQIDRSGGNEVKNQDVENLSADHQNALMYQTTGISPFVLLSEKMMANIISVADGQDNTWVVEIVPDESILSVILPKIDKMRIRISKETGLVKVGEIFYQGRLLGSVQFENAKLELALAAR